jgi:hypothetical protein
VVEQREAKSKSKSAVVPAFQYTPAATYAESHMGSFFKEQKAILPPKPMQSSGASPGFVTDEKSQFINESKVL